MYRPLDKIDFAICIDQIFNHINTLKNQKRSLLKDFNIDLLFLRVKRYSAIKLQKQITKRYHLLQNKKQKKNIAFRSL